MGRRLTFLSFFNEKEAFCGDSIICHPLSGAFATFPIFSNPQSTNQLFPIVTSSTVF